MMNSGWPPPTLSSSSLPACSPGRTRGYWGSSSTIDLREETESMLPPLAQANHQPWEDLLNDFQRELTAKLVNVDEFAKKELRKIGTYIAFSPAAEPVSEGVKPVDLTSEHTEHALDIRSEADTVVEPLRPTAHLTKDVSFYSSMDLTPSAVQQAESAVQATKTGKARVSNRSDDSLGGEESDDCISMGTAARTTKLDMVLNSMPSEEFFVVGQTPHSLLNHILFRIRVDQPFQMLILDVIVGIFIVLNAVEIGMSSDFHRDWHGWNHLDAIFALIFGVDLAVKFWLLGPRSYLFGEDRAWSWFEICMVIFGFVEVSMNYMYEEGLKGEASNLPLLRLVRLARIARLLRVCRLQIFDELKIMIKGALGGIKTLFWATIVINLPLYAVAIMFRETLGPSYEDGDGAEVFRTVASSFFTLFRCIVGSDCTDKMGRPLWLLIAESYGWGHAFCYCLIDLLTTFGLFNVIIAIFIENVLAGAKTNDQMMKRERLRDKTFFASKMTELVRLIVEVYSLMEPGFLEDAGVREIPTNPRKLLQIASQIEITPEVLEEARRRPGATDILRDLALADEDTLNLFDTLDADGSGTIDLAELFDGIAKLRGAPCRSDVVAIHIMLQKFQMEFKDFGASVTNSLERHAKTLRQLRNHSRTPTRFVQLPISPAGQPSAAVVAASVAAAEANASSRRVSDFDISNSDEGIVPQPPASSQERSVFV